MRQQRIPDAFTEPGRRFPVKLLGLLSIPELGENSLRRFLVPTGCEAVDFLGLAQGDCLQSAVRIAHQPEI